MIDKGSELRQDYFLSEEEGRQQLSEFAATYSNKDEWEARARGIRQGILRGMELLPLPEKSPLNPIIHSRREYDGYVVENLALETLPGFFLTGNVYRPLVGQPPFPGLLRPHGHVYGPPDGRFHLDQQFLSATLARMGAVVVTYDMVGWGESTQFPDYQFNASHKQFMQGVRLQTWNSIRVVDFLTSMADVDAKRIGITGHSGGGTQAFLATAVDDRIGVSVPVVMVAAHMFGGCNCESGMPIHKSSTHETDNVEIAALAAPRPQLLVSCGGDWTKNTPQVEYPYIRNVYSLYDAEERVENVHLPNDQHDYALSKRKGVYEFLAKHLGLSFQDVQNSDGGIDESPILIEDETLMHVFNTEHPRPDRALEDVKMLEW